MQTIPRSRYLLFVLLAGLGCAWDLATKHVVFTDLGYPAAESRSWVPGAHETFRRPGLVEGQSVQYIQGWMTFRLFTSFNEGALWGIGQGWSWLFALLSVVAVGGVIYWLFFRGAAHSLWLTTALGLIIAGTLGNLYDRLGLHGCVKLPSGEVRHAVRDFLLFTFGEFAWPVFNFADVFLVTGAIMLVVQSLWMSEPATQGEATTPAGAVPTRESAA